MMLSRWCPYPILSHWSWWQFFMSPTQIVLYMYCHQNQSPPNKRPVFKMPPRKCYFLCFHFRWCRISRYQNRNESSDSYFDNVKSYHLKWNTSWTRLEQLKSYVEWTWVFYSLPELLHRSEFCMCIDRHLSLQNNFEFVKLASNHFQSFLSDAGSTLRMFENW